MGTSSPWPLIHEEREALLADVEQLSQEQWSTPSLCAGWTVHDVLGHMTSAAMMTPPRFFGHFARSGFRFDEMNARDAAEQTRGTPADTVARFRSQRTATTHPPGPAEAMLGEAVVHAEDIRRPLGIVRKYPDEALIRAADFYKGSNLLIGAKNRINGLTLRATDTDWSTGQGPEVSGPMLALVMAATGRRAALADLSGDGLATLAARV